MDGNAGYLQFAIKINSMNKTIANDIYVWCLIDQLIIKQLFNKA